jgi:hypothetical protein
MPPAAAADAAAAALASQQLGLVLRVAAVQVCVVCWLAHVSSSDCCCRRVDRVCVLHEWQCSGTSSLWWRGVVSAGARDNLHGMTVVLQCWGRQGWAREQQSPFVFRSGGASGADATARLEYMILMMVWGKQWQVWQRQKRSC